MEEAKPKVALEVCEDDFERFLQAMDLKEKTENLDEDDKKGLSDHKKVIIGAMQKGTLAIDEAGQPVFTPSGPDSSQRFIFREPRGVDLMELDRVQSGHNVGRMNVLMGSMTRTHAKAFAALPLRDYRVCSAIVALFLA
jgi:hypothetical protein